MGLNYRFEGATGKYLDIYIPMLAKDFPATSDIITDNSQFYSFFDQPYINNWFPVDRYDTYPPHYGEYDEYMSNVLKDGFMTNVQIPANSDYRQINEHYFRQGLFDIDLVNDGVWKSGNVTLEFFYAQTKPELQRTGLTYALYVDGVPIRDIGASPSIDNNYGYNMFFYTTEENFINNGLISSTNVIGNEAGEGYVGVIFAQHSNDYSVDLTGVGKLLHDIATHTETFDPFNPYEEDTDDIDGGGSPVPPIGGGIDSLPLPTLSLSGLAYNLYQVTGAQLYTLMSDLWDETWLEDLLDSNEYKLSNIVSLHILPFTHASSVTTDIKLGNKTSSSGQLTTEYVQINCGSVKISKLLDNYLINEPYTNIQMYLPYVGMVDLCPSKINGRTIKVMYNVHIPTGYGIASIWTDGVLFATYTCNMYTQCPISANGNSTFMSSIGSLINLANNPSASGLVDAVASVGKASQGNTLTNGTYGSVAGFMNLQRPYMVRSYPNMVVPKNSGRLMGKPTYKYGKIKDAGAGFVRVDKVKLDGINCSDTVKNQIENALLKGVYW